MERRLALSEEAGSQSIHAFPKPQRMVLKLRLILCLVMFIIPYFCETCDGVPQKSRNKEFCG